MTAVTWSPLQTFQLCLLFGSQKDHYVLLSTTHPLSCEGNVVFFLFCVM